MFTEHLIIGEDFYIDPVDGGNHVIECRLLAKHPHHNDLYVFQSTHGKHLYIIHQEHVYKDKRYAVAGQQIRRIRQGGKDRAEDLTDLVGKLNQESLSSGEHGYRIRQLLHKNQHLISPPNNQ